MTRTSIAFGLVLAIAITAAVRSEQGPVPRPKPKPAADIEAPLTGQSGYAKAKGTARYRNRPEERELEVDLDKIPLPSGTMLNVELNGRQIGTVKVGLLHGANLKLRSKDNEAVPFVIPGTIVTVRTVNRAAVVSGRF